MLVHGAWADGSIWTGVSGLLRAAGYPVVVVRLELASLDEDIAVVRAALAAHDGPTVLVGHSYGGAVITGAGAGAPGVVGLVYIAAVAPDAGESALTCVAGFPHAPGSEYLVPDARPGYLRIDPAAYAQVYMQDVDPAEASTFAATQKPIAEDALSASVGSAAWRALPSWYLVSEDDRMINPDAARALAARIGAVTAVARGAGHASPVSRPAAVARVIVAAAGG